MVVGVLVLLGLLLGANRFTASDITGGKVPVTMIDVQRAGGFDHLTPKQQTWVREKYLHDLQVLAEEVQRRRFVYASSRQRKHLTECDRVMVLLADALNKAQDGDPTLTQPLMEEVIDALRR
jgi:hypothetical protein